MPFDLIHTSLLNTTNVPAPAVVTATQRFAQIEFADPEAPTLAEMHRLQQERWHTRPDWMLTGETPKTLPADQADLPAGWTYDAGADTLSASGTVSGLDGWDFEETQILLGNSDDVEFITNCRFYMPAVAKADRVGFSKRFTGSIAFATYQGGRIRLLRKCLFTAGPTHEGGPFSPEAHITAFPEGGSSIPTIDVMEFCSFEAFGADAIKGAWRGIQRYNYFDAPWNTPDDATVWNNATTYQPGDVVYASAASGERQDWLKMCRVADTLGTEPNWSSFNSTNANWDYLDPHSDHDQSPDSPGDFTNLYYGNIYVMDQGQRRFQSRMHQIGIVTHLRFIPNGPTGNQGSREIHHNVFTDEVEFGAATPPIIQLPTSNIRAGAQITVENNWYQTEQLTAGTGSHITVQNNIPNWTPSAPATLSGITAAYGTNTNTLAYEFTPSLGGWMTVVVTSSAAAMTAREIIDAHREGTALASFEIDAEAGQAALGFGGVVLSNGQTVYAHGLYQAGGGIDTLAPVQTVTEGAGTNNTFSLTEMDFDGYVFDRQDSPICAAILQGQGRAGDQVRVRGVSINGNTEWYSGYVRNNGTWSIAMQVPEAQWANWYAPRAQLGTNGTILTGSNVFGCGDVIVVLGQSELHYWLDNDSYQNANFTRSIDAENLTVLIFDEEEGSPVIQTHRITSGSAANANVGCLSVANAMHHIAPGRKLMIVDGAENGTSPFALWNDSNSSRAWSEFEAMVDKARASGSEIGGVIMNWYNAPAASIATMLADWAPGMFGQLASGAAFTLGTNNTEGASQTGRVDHCFWDLEAAPTERGRGLFAAAKTKLHLMLPMPFNDNTSGTEAAGFPENQRMNSTSRAGILAFAADAKTQQILAAVGPGTHLADFDEGNTGTSIGIHPNVSDGLGVPWFALQHLPAVLRQAGQAVGEPMITGINVVNSTTVDVEVDLPNGGDLTTLAALMGAANPSPRPDHHQEVTGFQLERGGDKRAIRRTGTGYAANWTGTVTIQDAGSGTAPNRTGRVRIVFSNAVTPGNRLSWLDGQANAGLDLGDEAAKLFRWMLLEHVPAWYDASADYPFYGVPVRPQTTIPAIP